MPHTAFITFSWIFLNRIILVSGFIMFSVVTIYSQESFDIFGSTSNKFNSQFNLNNIESYVSNISKMKDWEFSITFGSEFSPDISSNIYLLSLAKKIGGQYFKFRYSPGYQKEFILNTGTKIISNDSVPTVLRSKFRYEERFGINYTTSVSSQLSAGVSFHYLIQENTEDQAKTIFADSVTSISTESLVKNYNFGAIDLGLAYSVNPDICLSISSKNLFTPSLSKEDDESFYLRKNKVITAGINWQMSRLLNTRFNYETNNSFSAGFNLGFNLWGGNLSLSSTIFHDKYQKPFLAGILPGINFSSRLFSASITGVKYFSSKEKIASYDDFVREGLHNIINNKYSYDKAFLSISFALNTKEEKLAKLVDVDIIKNIFPSQSDDYIENPFASGKVVNLTDKPVTVKPFCIIPLVNDERVYSPSVQVLPNDSAEVNFYALINNSNKNFERTEISQGTFYIITENSEPDDELSKPVLINDRNSWDGKVANLRYFVKHDYDFALQYSKNILGNYKSVLDTIPANLKQFYIISVLFNAFSAQMNYVADPRSSTDRVQFPGETIKLRGGDCDDLSSAFSSLLEGVGIQTAFIDYQTDSTLRHVSLLVNANLTPDEASLITNNDKKYYLRKNLSNEDEVWIPIETTSRKDFDEAWNIGAEKFYQEAIESLGLAKGKVFIVDVY